jgi:hypothetical protein
MYLDIKQVRVKQWGGLVSSCYPARREVHNVGIDVILLYRKKKTFVKEVLSAVHHYFMRGTDGLTAPPFSVRDGPC